MITYFVWCPRKEERSESRTVEAEDHEQAAEWDQEQQDNIHRRYDNPSSESILMVAGPDGKVYRVKVTGRMQTSYFGHAKEKVEES